jgi:hypothetical protein
MSIITKPIEAARHSPAFALYATLFMVVAVMSLALILAPSPTTPTVTAPTVASGDVVDGWEAGFLSAAAARLERVQDGYLPGLLAGHLQRDIVDGWMPAFFASASATDIRDGWEASLLP